MHKAEIDYLKEKNKSKEKKIMSFNFNLSSGLSAQTQLTQLIQLKILAISKKNSN